MPRYGFVPNIKPRMTDVELLQMLEGKDVHVNFNIDPIWVVGIRGYYLDTMGREGANDRGIYDDAIFILSKPLFRSYNGNTDPGVYRNGIAMLMPGVWRVYQLDNHRPENRPPYPALCQRGGQVTVVRDDDERGRWTDTGNFGINIHKGGYDRVSSIGCQTVYPEQWNEFIENVTNLALHFFGEKWSSTNIPYALCENRN